MRCVPTMGLVTALLWASVSFAFSDPGQRCQAYKFRAVGKYLACRYDAEARFATTPDFARYGANIAKCRQRFASAWMKADYFAANANVICPGSADRVLVQGTLDDDTYNVVVLLGGDHRYADNDDGTLTDRETGLTWEKKVMLDNAEYLPNLHDADNSLRWAGQCHLLPSKYCQPTAAAAAACAANVEGDAFGCGECGVGEGTCTASVTAFTWLVDLNATNFGGTSNWRLPTREELAGLRDLTESGAPFVDTPFHGGSCGAACSDVTDPACACTASNYYWSSTTDAVDNKYAEAVGFGDGGTGEAGKPFAYLRVRAVRNSP